MNDPSNPKPDVRRSGPGALVVVIRAIGRALIGAFAGLVVVGLTLLIASGHLRLITFRDPPASDPWFWFALGLGMVIFAFVAVVSGGAEIGGRAGEVIKGMLAGTAAGVIAGAVLGSMIGFKGASFAGIVFGGPMGAFIGGMIMSAPGLNPERKPKPPAPKRDWPEDDLF